MNTVHDYESLGFITYTDRAPVMEAFTGTAIVGWQGRIEGQLVKLLADAEKGRNFTYADKLREFLKIWRSNEITGSINRETLEILKSAADILSVDSWQLAAYFRSLKDQLRILIASEEQLPRGAEDTGNDPMVGGGRGGPPMSPSFGPGGGPPTPPGGPEPGGPETPEGTPESPEAALETPENEPGAPDAGEAGPEPPEPDEMPGNRFGLA